MSGSMNQRNPLQALQRIRSLMSSSNYRDWKGRGGYNYSVWQAFDFFLFYSWILFVSSQSTSANTLLPVCVYIYIYIYIYILSPFTKFCRSLFFTVKPSLSLLTNVTKRYATYRYIKVSFYLFYLFFFLPIWFDFFLFCTCFLGASTTQAREAVAIEMLRVVNRFFEDGTILNRVNWDHEWCVNCIRVDGTLTMGRKTSLLLLTLCFTLFS